ncbi:hypothetical protein [Dactylosporangium sp. NPDC051541]|uniref:hypothetical protein n=1 Tax=Dactylosporangium sp. NPDC051541 TaxID=3363977 RepID=UPI0037B5BB50
MLIEVRSRVPGRDRDEMPVATVEAADVVTVGELIAGAVAEQVRLLGGDMRRRALLDRHYLTDADIREQAAGGAIRPPGVEPDADVEAARARRAFERGAFVVFAGGRRLEHLDDPVILRAGEPVLFLRLTPLVGG